jgi:two-component system, cell cycle sensor histidine kinase and response regulator CckA
LAWGTQWRSAARIAVAYAVIASLWILLSDRLLYLIQPDPQEAMRWAIYKGWAFVVVTATLLAIMLLAEGRSLARSHDDLRQAEEHLRLLGDNLPDTYVFQVVEDESGASRITYLSAGADRVHGIRPADLMAADYPNLSQFDPYDRERLIALRNASGLAMKEYGLDVRFRRRDGEWRWLHVGANPRRTLGGRLMWDGVATDITERLQAEEALRNAQELVQLAIDGADIGVWRHDIPAGTVHLDDRARGHFGLASGDTTIEMFVGGIHPLDADKARDELAAQTAPDSEGRFSTEFRVLHPDGTVRWLALGVRVRYETTGDVRRAVQGFGTTQDITDRRMAEAALRESEMRFQQVTEHVGEWVWEVDADGLYTYVSPVVEKVLGYRPNEMVGRMHFYDLFLPEHREAQKTAAFAHFRDARPFVRFRNETRHKDGHIVVQQTSGTPIVDADGRLNGYRGVDDDITDRERLEAQYLRAQRLEGVGALASGIAHDLNNILAPIRMVVPLVRESTQDPESLAMLDTIETSAERGADIIKQLLTFARGRPGVRVPLPLRHLVRDMAKIARETFPRDIQAHTDVPADLWPLLGDATQVHQALMNLCVNSRDAMPDGGVLTIAARNATIDAERAVVHPDATPGDYVCLSVGDTGEGIPRDHLDRIFDPFFTTKEIGQGTGLGLATVLGIVRGHGGFIVVETLPGSGTTFELYFPAAPHHDAEVPAVSDSRPGLGAGELILVVDDEAAVRETVRTALEAFGYRVAMATDGADGLEVFRTVRDDVKAVLTDMMMPVMNGPTMIGRLRAVVPHLVVVGMTGLPERSGVKGLETLEVNALLTKPFSVDELLRTLEHALHGPRPTPDHA